MSDCFPTTSERKIRTLTCLFLLSSNSQFLYLFLAQLYECTGRAIAVVDLLFYIHGKHLRSCRDGQLTKPHFSWAGLDLLSS